MVQSASNGGPLDVPHNFFMEIKMASHLYVGIADSTMSHGEGWQFGHLRQLLERADKTARHLDGVYFMLLPAITDAGASDDDVPWSAVLKSASGFEMYRRRHGMITPQQVADFLMLDRDFPRPMHYCVGMAEASLHAISGSPAGTFQNSAERSLGRLRAVLDYAQIQEITSSGLHEFLVEFQRRLNEVNVGIFETFLTIPSETATANA